MLNSAYYRVSEQQQQQQDVQVMEPAAQCTHIDGSLLEGGGQILRNATALSAIAGKSIRVDKIRAGRKNPGLSPQHLTGLQLVANITAGQLEGGAIRSTCISFSPGPRPACVGDFTADTKTAGSCTLLVQQALPVLLFAANSNSDSSAASRPSKRSKPGGSVSCLTLKGGTDAAFAPPVGYLQHVFLPILKRLTAPLTEDLSIDVPRRGFYPKGGGQVELRVPPLPPGATLPAWNLTDRGHLVKVTGYAVTAGKLRPDICQRMVSSATKDLKVALQDPAVLFGMQHQQQGSIDCIPSVVVDVEVVHEPPEHAFGDGGSIMLVAETSTGALFGASALAERGVTAEAVGAMAARDLLEELRSGAAVDHWMQDQLIVFMALAQGRSKMLCAELTLHTRTAMSIAQQLLPEVQFEVSTVSVPASAGSSTAQGSPGLLYCVTCTGAAVAAAL